MGVEVDLLLLQSHPVVNPWVTAVLEGQHAPHGDVGTDEREPAEGNAALHQEVAGFRRQWALCWDRVEEAFSTLKDYVMLSTERQLVWLIEETLHKSPFSSRQ